MSDSNTAISHIYKSIKNFSANMLFHSSILVTLGYAFSSGSIDSNMFAVFGVGVGVNLLSGVIDRMLNGENVSEDEIRQIVQSALEQTNFDSLLTENEFKLTMAKLSERQELWLTHVIGEFQQETIVPLLDLMKKNQMLTAVGLRAIYVRLEQEGNKLDNILDILTDTEILSASFLFELSKKSLLHYRQQFTNPETWITRQFDTHLNNEFSEQLYKSYFLVGKSGFGKSALAYQLLEEHVASGKLGFYVPEYIVETAVSREDALRMMLDKLHPNIRSSEKFRIEEIVAKKPPFIIVVDDINRAANPVNLIRKLTAWATPHFLIICPIWPRFWNQSRDFVSKPEIEVIKIGRMSEDDAVQAIEKIVSNNDGSISFLNARKVAWKLALDPFLIGSFSDALFDNSLDDITKQIDDIVSRRIDTHLHKVSQKSSNKYHESEYQETLSILVMKMLENRNLYPDWKVVKQWMQDIPGDDHLSILRELYKHRGLCEITEVGKFRFFHDRFLDYFVLQEFENLLSDPVENKSILLEPYYANWLGRAIVNSPQSEPFLDELYENLPLALVATIDHIGVATNDYHQLLIKKIKQWVNHKGADSRTPESIRGAVANKFINTDSPLVLEIVNTSFGLEVDWFGVWARFRNGDTESGINYCFRLIGEISGINRHQGDLWEDLIDHVRRNHHKQMTDDLKPVLVQSLKNNLSGALILSGFLRLAELQDSIEICWHSLSDKAEYFVQICWAALRCSPDLKSDTFLDLLMTNWASPPVRDVSNSEEWAQRITERLANAIALDADQAFVDYLIEQSQKFPILRPHFAYICGMIDLPNGIEFAVRTCKETGVKDQRCSVGTWGRFEHNPKLSSASTKRLQELWSGEDNSAPIRKFSFQLWLKNVDENSDNVLEVLAHIPTDVPFNEDVVRSRTRLGDSTCVLELIPYLESDSDFFHFAHKVWSEELLPVTDNWLESFSNIPSDYSVGAPDDHHYLAEMLILIPIEHAEPLLKKHWEYLKFGRLFVQAALYIGTQQLLTLAADAVTRWPETINLFYHVDIFFGFANGFSKESISLQKLKNLQPYLSFLEEDVLFDYANACYELGVDGIEWCKQNLPDAINLELTKRYFPSEENYFTILDNLARHPNNSLDLWLRKFGQLDGLRIAIEISTRWFSNSPTYARLRLMGRWIEIIGNRDDLAILDIPIEDDWWEKSGNADAIRESVKFSVRRRTLE